MDRRDFLVAWIHILLLSIFPWMRPHPEIAKKVAEELVIRHAFKGGDLKFSICLRGYEVDTDWHQALRENPNLMRDALIPPRALAPNEDQRKQNRVYAKRERADRERAHFFA